LGFVAKTQILYEIKKRRKKGRSIWSGGVYGLADDEKRNKLKQGRN